MKKLSQCPEPEALHGFLTKNYQNADYHSVYEAGFCGFWLHERLTALGIYNIIVNPADAPTKSSEKRCGFEVRLKKSAPLAFVN